MSVNPKPSGSKRHREERPAPPPPPPGDDDHDMPDTDEDKATGMTPKRFYLLLVEAAREVFAGLDLTYDVNGEMAFSQIIHAMSSPPIKEMPLPDQLTRYFEGRMGTFQLTDGQEVALRALNEGTPGYKKSLMPLLTLYQVMLKTKEEIIYSKTSVTKDLNLPRYLESLPEVSW